jgi:methyl-accepting chemotaxis protein
MEWIKNLKIAQKLQLLITIATVVALVLSSVGFYYTNKAKNAISELYNVKLLAISSLADMTFASNNAMIENLKLLQPASPEQNAKMLAAVEKFKKDCEDSYKEYTSTPLLPYEQERVNKISSVIEKYWKCVERSSTLGSMDKMAEGYRVFKQGEASLNEYEDLVDELMKFNQKTAVELFEQNQKDANAATAVLLIVSLSAIGLLISLGLMISNMITRPIKNAIDNLNVGTEEVSSAASQVAAASQQLAEGTSEQASSIQETSSTLEETSSMVHQNRENTQQAASLATQTKQYAEKSNLEMGRVMTSMGELKSSSNEIAKIIKVIDEIAFQTNILSLNAAVEAARAGDAGKGFAVVAEEVRNLAQRSAQAAKDTAVIIESNINLSDNGVDIAKAVRDSVASIEDQAKKVSDLLDEINVATNEQAQGVEQINKAVSQMEIVLSANAQTAEESASASRTLSDQAVNVKDIVNTLIVLVDGAEAVHRQAQRQMSGVASRYIAPQRQYNERVSANNNLKIGTRSSTPEDIIPLGEF